jgi:hypothetical protein
MMNSTTERSRSPILEWTRPTCRKSNGVLQSLLAADRVLCHALIVLEIACRTPPAPRERTLGDLKKLQQSVIATTEETLALIEKEQLQELGRGAVDMSSRPKLRHPSWPDSLAGMLAGRGATQPEGQIHSHSMVAGGFPEMSYTTREIPRTSLMIRCATRSKNS